MPAAKRATARIARLASAAIATTVAMGVAHADTTSELPSKAYQSKKDAWLAAKADQAQQQQDAEKRQKWEKSLDRRIGKEPPKVINIYNTWTNEFLVLDADPDVVVEEPVIDSFLRCHFTNEPADMDTHTFAVLAKAAVHFKADRVQIVSGFRSPKYNLILRKKGRNVARNSQHTYGKAIDFRIPGVPIARLHAFVRKLRLGGVGFYPVSRFVHVDTGPVRSWTGK